MPAANRFCHQSYPTSPAVVPQLKTLTAFPGEPAQFAALHAEHRIAKVILVHGTFQGDDPLGIAEMLKSIGASSPLMSGTTDAIANELLARTRPFMSTMAGDIGNYTVAYRDHFQILVGDDPKIELLEPTWSSQNHHLARADLAVRLLHQLLQRPIANDQRVLLWGHSHAGNAFALLTNLLANDRATVEAFFDAAGTQPGAQWQEVRSALAISDSPHPLASQLLIATFETPVRYGWDTTGCAGLVHVVFHRVDDAAKPFAARPMFPPHSLADMMNATWGDWVQAFAIAGTDVPTLPSLASNKRLATIVEAGLKPPSHGIDTRLISPHELRDACARWKFGTRCHADGINLLVDYEPSGELTAMRRPIESSLLGHGVATTVAWLPAHLEAVIAALGE